MPTAAERINSPVDIEARYSIKADLTWTGYKIFLTETCDPEQPRLLTQVSTSPATTQDMTLTAAIQADLKSKDLTTAGRILSSTFVSQPPTAILVPAACCVIAPSRVNARFLYVPRSRTKRCSRHGNGRDHRSLLRNMPGVQGSSAPSGRVYVTVAYATRATSDKPKRICKICW